MDSEGYEVFLGLSLFFFGNLENDLCTLENGCGKVKLSYLEDTCIVYYSEIEVVRTQLQPLNVHKYAL